jgi:hypothetical protein
MKILSEKHHELKDFEEIKESETSKLIFLRPRLLYWLITNK